MRALHAEWTAADRHAISRLLASAQAKRTSRLLSVEAVLTCAEAAVAAPLGLAWITGGAAPDARGRTTVCLCAVVGARVTIGIGVAHGAPTPELAFADLKEWSRTSEAANRGRVEAWASRPRADRLRVGLREVQAEAPLLEALLARVLERPDDDAPREIYADALSERGDPRGEFIQVQLSRARGSVSAALEARELELLQAHGQAWAGVDPKRVEVSFRRGFVERAVVRDRSLLEDGLFLREPVVALEVRPSPPSLDVAALLAMPWVPRLRALTFASSRLLGGMSGEPFRALLETRALRELQALGFEGQRLGDRGLAALSAQAPAAFPRLQRLSVREDSLGVTGLAALCATKWGRALEHVDLSANGLSSTALEVLLRGAPLRWRSLTLDGDELGNAGAVLLATSERLAALQALSLRRNRIGVSGLEALLGTRRLGALKTLELEGNELSASSMAAVARRFG